MIDYFPTQFHIKTRVFKKNAFFGKGVVILLKEITKNGSLRAAYKSIGMSSSKAWKIIKRAETDLGVPLVIGKAGGKSNGGSVVTVQGKDLMQRYQKFTNDIEHAAQIAFKKHFSAPRRQSTFTIISFPTTTMAFLMEQQCKKNEKDGRLIPLPKEISAGCGLVWRSKQLDEQQWKAFLKSHNIAYDKIKRLVM